MPECAKKKVCFVDKPVVYRQHHWLYAYKSSRKGAWMAHAVDRFRFSRRINIMETILKPILLEKHKRFREGDIL